MYALQRGERVPLSKITPTGQLTLTAVLPMPTPADLSLFGLDDARRLSDDRYFIFYNQDRSPESAIVFDQVENQFSIDLARIPLGVHRLVLTATNDAEPFSGMGTGRASLMAAGVEVARMEVSGALFQDERALILLELYRHQGGWRVAGVGQGFSGGLQALLESVGGVVISDPTPAPAPPDTEPPVAPSWLPLASSPSADVPAGQCVRCERPE